MPFLAQKRDQARIILSKKLEVELTILSLFCYAAYFNNPEKSGAQDAMEGLGGGELEISLSKADYQRALQAIERVTALGELLRAQL